MSYRFIVLDIDGTLRPHKATCVPRGTARAITAVQKTGVKVAIATGRGRTSVPKELLNGFEEDLLNYGIGSVPEAYDGDAPHDPCGAISYAPSVAALLQIHRMIRETEKNR